MVLIVHYIDVFLLVLIDFSKVFYVSNESVMTRVGKNSSEAFCTTLRVDSLRQL